MADEEYYEEEAPLTAEELFQQHQAEINAAFEEKGFFRRMGDMFSGLSKPKSSAEYKLAKTEMQRLAAPILAILLPTLGVIALIVITAITGQKKEVIQFEVAKVDKEEEQLDEEEPPPEEIIEETPPDETVDIQVDTPVVGPVSDVVNPAAPPTTEPVSVKPAPADSVALIKSPITMKSMAGSRTPGMRGQMTRGGGSYGDANTEGAVLKALRWFKKTQKSDGGWGSIANTAIVVLAYLAHGETPGSKEFGQTVMKAIQNLIDAQTERKDGYVTYRGADGNEYSTLIATYALCEAYGMTKNPNAKIAALRGMTRIVDNQSETGGWDYGIKKESNRDDMSFGGWALQAVKAGKMAGLHPEGLDACIKKAIRCLKTRIFKNNGFAYTAGGSPTPLTATGCLCMQLLGYMNDMEVKASLDYMREWTPSFEGEKNGGTPGSAPQYYDYYAAQCKYQAGMCEGAKPENVQSWQSWNAAMKAKYPPNIIEDGEIEDANGKMQKCGYWKGGYNNPTMGTGLIALQLMVYYRYLPTTQTKAAKAESDEPSSKSGKKKGKEVSVEVDI